MSNQVEPCDRQKDGASVSILSATCASTQAVADRAMAGDLLTRLAAAERRVAELENLNGALRSGIDVIAHAGCVETILDSFLHETVRLTGAPCGALAVHSDGSEFSLRSITGCLASEIHECSLTERFRVAARQDQGGLMKRVLRGETFGASLLEIEQWCPDLAQFYAKRGQRYVWHFPIKTNNEVTGFLALAFPEECSFCDWKNSVVQVLSQQAALALSVVRIAESAKACAVARERSQMAEDVAAELSQVNRALRAATDRLGTQTELGSFYGQLLQQAVSLLQADSASLTVIDEGSGVLRKLAYLKHGALCVPDSAMETPLAETSAALQRLRSDDGIQSYDPHGSEEIFWPGAAAFYRETECQTVLAVPLKRSEHYLGFVLLAFREQRELTVPEQELLRAMAQHMTLAMHLMGLSDQVRRGAVLEERVALARDLHDTLLQGFTGVALQLRALLKKPQTDSEKLRSILQDIEAEATRSVREARRAVGDIRGIEPGTSDLVTALQELVQSESARTQAHLCWRLEGEQIDLPRAISESLFLIGREALTNAIRHAHASSIEVALSMSAKEVKLLVKDNGQGFILSEEALRQQGHWGLIGIEERMERLRGECQIQSHPGGGTTVSIGIPL